MRAKTSDASHGRALAALRKELIEPAVAEHRFQS
jgi:hypothetical protein